MGVVYALPDAQAMTTTLYDPAFWSRFQFGFTLVYHYLFPQLTMGLAWLSVLEGAPANVMPDLSAIG